MQIEWSSKSVTTVIDIVKRPTGIYDNKWEVPPNFSLN